jgi:uncharacterized protein (DUF433 family)
MVDYRKIITLEPGKRGGKPCIRGIRITVGDVLGWLAAGMSHAEIIEDYPDLTEEDIQACLAFAADKERHSVIAFSHDQAPV